MEHTSNKNRIAQFYKQVVGQRDSSLINTFVHEDYIQHSAAGKGGRQGLFEMVEFLKTLPPSAETKSPVKMLLGDGDLVAILLDISFMGKRMLVIDIFRLQDGMLAEHWDAVQEIDSDMIIDHITIDENATEALANKDLIANLLGTDVRRVIAEGDVAVAQSAITVDGKLYASYDIYRVANGVAIHQLNIRQQVPDVMMHDNGMI